MPKSWFLLKTYFTNLYWFKSWKILNVLSFQNIYIYQFKANNCLNQSIVDLNISLNKDILSDMYLNTLGFILWRHLVEVYVLQVRAQCLIKPYRLQVLSSCFLTSFLPLLWFEPIKIRFQRLYPSLLYLTSPICEKFSSLRSRPLK